MKKISAVTMILWIVGWTIAYFFILPPINPGSVKFWAFFGPALILPVFAVSQALSLKGGVKKGKAFWPVMVALVAAAVVFGGMLICSPLLSASRYASRIAVTTSSFEEDIQEVDFDNLPLLDKVSCQKVGDRVVGQIPEMVSQFDVSPEYSLINYNGTTVRVTPLEYAGFYKYLANHDGTSGYVVVNTTTGEAQLVQTEQGLKYLPSAYFFHNLNRHVQCHYPFAILGDTSFELDEDGTPYWVIEELSYTWVNTLPRVSGVILCNAQTGELARYPLGEVPAWVDNVCDAALVLDEINDWGLYQGGYVNSQLSQKNVVQATDGYTYVTHDDDVFLYTGITSVVSDESNIGFVMVNLRTHQASFYAVAGAEEYSAMDSAKGAVQEKNYTPTFPLLINLGGRPTYLLSLKDDAGLVKMYAFVDAQDYQKVSVSDASYGIKYAASVYQKMMNGETPDTPAEQPGSGEEVTGETTEDIITISEIYDVQISGNTYYYLVSTDERKFEVAASVDVSIVPFLSAGDTVKVTYVAADNALNKVTAISLLNELHSGEGEPAQEDPQSGGQTSGSVPSGATGQ